MTIKEALKLDNYSLEAEVLLLHSLKHKNTRTLKQISKSFLYSNSDFKLSLKAERKFKKLINKRATGVPVAYLTHHQEFYGLNFYVDGSVLVPRPETELLVELALEIIKNQEYRIKNILDLGAGSGNIIISIIVNSKQITDNSFYATDVSAKALKIAELNAKKHQAKINFIKSDLFKNIPEKLKFDLIIANLPYLWKNFPKFEPLTALDGGKDGLKIIEKFLQEVGSYLSPKGIILIEIDPRQAKKIKKLSKKYLPDKEIAIKKDLAGLDRVAVLS